MTDQEHRREHPGDDEQNHLARDVATLVVERVEELPDGLSAQQFREALTTAGQRWSYPQVDCTSLVVEVAEGAEHRRTERDGRSLFVFRNRRWCHNELCGPGRTFPPLAAAMTTVYDEASGATVAEADVELNGAAFAASYAHAHTSAPLVSVLVHELGHVLGFQDTCGTRHGARPDPQCARDELESVMLSGSGRERLTGWDIERLCRRFPREARTPAARTRHEQPGSVGALLGWLTLAAVAALAIGFVFARSVARKDSR